MAKGLLSLAAGFGGGYLAAQRQAKLDDQTQEDRDMRKQEFGWRADDRKKADDLQLSLANAVKPLAVQNTTSWDTGDEVGDSGAPETFSLGDARRFTSAPAAQAVAGTENTPDGKNNRTALAYEKAGKPIEALQYQNAVTAQKSGAIDLASKMRIEADDKSNRLFDQYTNANGGNAFAGASQIITDTDQFGMKGVVAKPVVSPDGKMVNIMATMPDGTQQTLRTYTNDERGRRDVRTDFLAQPMDKRLKLVDDHLKADREASKDGAEIALKNAQVGYYNSLAGKADKWAPGGGSQGAADRFDAKEWDAAFSKSDKSIISLPNAMGDKEEVSPDLSAARRALIGEIRSAGSMAPHEAVTFADEKIMALRNRASDIVEQARASDPKSTLTVQKVIADMLKRARQSGAPQNPQPAATQPPAAAPVAPKAPSLADAVAKMPPNAAPARQVVGETGNKSVVDAMAPRRIPSLGNVVRRVLPPVDEDLRSRINATLEQ